MTNAMVQPLLKKQELCESTKLPSADNIQSRFSALKSERTLLSLTLKDGGPILDGSKTGAIQQCSEGWRSV
jgi:hypothetical protein